MTYTRRGLIGGTDVNRYSGVVDFGDYLSLLNNSKSVGNYSGSYDEFSIGYSNTYNCCLSKNGKKLYVSHGGDFIREYTLTTAFDITTATFVRQWDHTYAESSNIGINISPDGKYFYICGTDRDNPLMFTASTPYDISTLTYGYNTKLLDNIFNLGSADTELQCFEFGDSGNKLYLVGSGDDNVQQFSLSTPYDVETQSYDAAYTLTGVAIPTGIYWKPDGTRFFIMNLSNDSVYEYSCSNAWDVTTGTITQVQSASVSSQDTSPVGLTFKPDGTKMYITGDSGNEIDEYNLGTAWDINTLSFVQVKTGVSNGNPGNISFSPDGTKMFLTSRGNSGPRVDQFELSIAWDISTAGSPTFTYRPNESPLTTTTNSRGFIVFLECAVFGDDGMSISLMDIYSSLYDKIITYRLGSAYDISTIFNGVLGSSKDGSNNPSDIAFNNSGTKCYVSDYADRYIYQYSLDTPWVVGEGNKTYDGSLNLVSYVGSSGLYAIDFNPTGTVLFVSDRSTDDILTFTVSIPFDLTSTVTFLEEINVSSADVLPSGVKISDIGHKMYFV